jgi:preprotein translocase subunit SecE
MSKQQLAYALVVVAVLFIVYAALSFGIDAGNKKALLAVALAGASTTAAAWFWPRSAAT